MYYFIKQSPCTLIGNILGIEPLKDKDSVLDYGSLGNFSLSGFEMVLTRYVSTYIITYYLPSGKKTNVLKGVNFPIYIEETISFTIIKKAPTRVFSWLARWSDADAFNHVKSLVGAFSVIVKLQTSFPALIHI